MNLTPFLDQLADAINADKHGGLQYHFFSECFKRKIIPEIPEHWHEDTPTTPLPSDWAAIEFTLFDNGNPTAPTRKRSRVPTTGTKYGGTIKAWRTTKINFAKPAPWKYTVSFYTPSAALAVAHQQKKEAFIDQDTADMVSEIVAKQAPKFTNCFIGLARRISPKFGSSWLKGHVFFVAFHANEPDEIIIISPEFMKRSDLVDRDAASKPLIGKAVGQARMSEAPELSGWIS